MIRQSFSWKTLSFERAVSKGLTYLQQEITLRHPARFDGLAIANQLSVSRRILDDNDVTRHKCGRQDLFEIARESCAVHGVLEDHRCGNASSQSAPMKVVTFL